jgi:hypothetical protein
MIFNSQGDAKLRQYINGQTITPGATAITLPKGAQLLGDVIIEAADTEAAYEEGYNTGYAAGYAAGQAAAIPYSKELQYIKGDGAQYIDTGFKPNNNSCYEIKYQTVPTQSYVGIMGAEHGWGSASFALWCKHAGFCNSTITNQTWYGETPVIMKFNKGILYKDGVQVWSANGTFQCNYNAYLFGINRAGTLTEPVDNLKIYYAKIWDNGTLVRDYIPVLDKSGVACLYDKVNKQFYYNAGSGVFTYAE